MVAESIRDCVKQTLIVDQLKTEVGQLHDPYSVYLGDSAAFGELYQAAVVCVDEDRIISAF